MGSGTNMTTNTVFDPMRDDASYTPYKTRAFRSLTPAGYPIPMVIRFSAREWAVEITEQMGLDYPEMYKEVSL